MSELALDSLRRRMRAMHSLWEEALATMDEGHVNHVERSPLLPIAFSAFHLLNIEDFSASALGAGPMIWNGSWQDRVRVAIPDHGKERTVEEMMGQRIGDMDGFRAYAAAVFARTEEWLAGVDPASLTEVIVGRPFPPGIASTFSARVAAQTGMTRLDGAECWIYQHGLRHMGEVEHARALVGLGGLTS